MAASRLNPLLHYVEYGAFEGRRPNPDFNGRAYLRKHPELRSTRTNPLLHALNTGAFKRSATQTPDAAPAAPPLSSAPAPLALTRADGPRARIDGQDSQLAVRPIEEVVAAISDSGLFDPAFYRETNPDVRDADEDALVHFCAVGWREGRAPNAYFDPLWYLEQNPDVASAALTRSGTSSWREKPPVSAPGRSSIPSTMRQRMGSPSLQAR